MKNTKAKLLEGGLIGAALGVAAGIFLMSETAENLGGDLKKKSADFYEYLAPKLKKMKKMGEADYKIFVENAAKAYGKSKKLSAEESKILMDMAHKSWNLFKKHIS